jgi:hypothetical protein
MTLLTLLDSHGALPPPPPPLPPSIKVESPAELPHFNAPFQIGRQGAIVVEQGSPENERANIYNIAVCPKGFRDDLPDFGIPDPTFQTLPLDLKPIEEALRKYEPAADITVAQHLEGLAAAGVLVTAS